MTELFIAQREDATRHRYQFFDGHVPALPKIYVEQRGEPAVTGAGDGGGAAVLLTVPEMLARHANVIVVSGPGMGKSTMVMQIQHQQVCWWLSSTMVERQQSGPFGRVLPVMVPASMLVERSLSEAVSEVARRLGCRYTLRSLFDPLPIPGVAWLIMVDGIDEVLTRQERSAVLTKVAHGIEHAAPWMRFLLTTRPLPFGDLAEIRAQRVGEFVLRHFDDKNLATFAHKWFTARAAGAHETQLAEQFLDQVAAARLGPVVQVPLLATIAALVFDSARDRPLPTSRAGLYEQFVTHLLHGRGLSIAARQRVQAEFGQYGEAGVTAWNWLATSFTDLLEHLADGYLKASPTAITRRVRSWMLANCPDRTLGEVPGWEGHVRAMLTSTSLLIERDGDIDFTHHSFAEYLAAGPRARHFDRAAWLRDVRNPAKRSFAAFVLMRSFEPADELVQALVDGLGEDVIAAGDVLADGLEVAPALHQRVVAALTRQLTTEDPTAPEALRVLNQLGDAAFVVSTLSPIVADPQARPWVRVMVADTLDERDRSGRLQSLALDTSLSPDARRWAEQRHTWRTGGPATAADRIALDEPASLAPVSVLARYAYRQALESCAGSPEYQLTVALSLAGSGDPAGAAAVRHCLTDRGIRFDLRLQAARAIRDLAEEGAVHLRQIAESTTLNSDIRATAAIALAEVSDETGQRILSELDKGDPSLRKRLTAVGAVLDPMSAGEPATAGHPESRLPLVSAASRVVDRVPQVWGNVPPRNPNFTGRESLLSYLRDRLAVEREMAVLPRAFSGMGGVGKSQLAIEYVHRHREDYDLIWWIPAEYPSQVLSALTALAHRLDLDGIGEANTAVPAVREALSTGSTPYENWLLVFDNAEALSEVRPYFPTGGAGKILITSRNPEWAAVARSLEVDVFTRTESKTFLIKRAPEVTEAEADRLADALGDLPLAVELAAAWRVTTGMSVDEYLRLLEEKRIELLELGASPLYELSVAAAWNVSLDKLEQINLAALQLLQVCSFFASEPISRDLFAGSPSTPITDPLDETLRDSIKLARAIRDIQRYALAKFDHRNNTLQMHRLVRAMLVSRMDEALREVMRRGAHTLLADANPNNPDVPAYWSRYQALQPHVVASEAVISHDLRVHRLVLNMLKFLYFWGDHEGCAEFAKEVHEQRQADLGDDHEHTLDVAKWRAWSLFVLGSFKEAAQINKRLLELYYARFDEADEGALDAMLRVAADLRVAGDFADALALDRKAVERCRRVLGDDDPATLRAQHHLAVSLLLIGAFDEAWELNIDTYRRECAVLGESKDATMETLNKSTMDLREKGDYLDARVRQEEVYESFARVFGSAYPATLRTAGNLAVARRKAGDLAGARTLAVETLQKLRWRYGDDSLDTMAAALGLAIDLRHSGELDAALNLTEATLDRYRRRLGPHHPFTFVVQADLAVAQRLQGHVREAVGNNTEALDGLRARLGSDHPWTLACAVNLASDHYALADPQAALERDTDTFRRLKKTLGPRHPTSLLCGVNLALDLRALGHKDSEREYLTAIEHLREVLGEDHPAVVNAARGDRSNIDIDVLPL